MISRRVNSLRDEFYPDFEMVLHNRTLEYPSRKALKLERHLLKFHLQSHGVGRRRSQTSFLSMSLWFPETYIWSLKYHKKHNEQLCEKRSQELVTLGGGGVYGPPDCLPCVTSVHTNEKKVSYLCLDDTKYAGGTFEKVYWQLQNVCHWAAANNI